MGDAEPSGHGLEGVAPGARVSVRRRFADGFHDVVGFVVAMDADSLTVLDRTGVEHQSNRAAIGRVRWLP